MKCLKKQIARKIMESELQQKHIEKRKIKKKILEMLKLKNNVASIIYRTVFHQIDKIIKSQRRSILTRHGKNVGYSKPRAIP